MKFWLYLAATLGTGLVSGVFFAFSSFVMRSLGKLPPAQGLAAMQAINVWVINASFMMLLFGTAVLCLISGAWSLAAWGRDGSGWALAGAISYLLGTIGTTLAWNVPRNDALAKIDPAHPDSAAIWASYVTTWTAGNHVRTLMAAVACACFVMAIRAMSRQP